MTFVCYRVFGPGVGGVWTSLRKMENLRNHVGVFPVEGVHAFFRWVLGVGVMRDVSWFGFVVGNERCQETAL